MNRYPLIGLLTLLLTFMQASILYSSQTIGKARGRQPIKKVTTQKIAPKKPETQIQGNAATQPQQETISLSPQKTALKELITDFNAKFGNDVDREVKEALDAIVAGKPLPTSATVSPVPPTGTTPPQARPAPRPTPTAQPTALIQDLLKGQTNPLKDNPQSN